MSQADGGGLLRGPSALCERCVLTSLLGARGRSMQDGAEGRVWPCPRRKSLRIVDRLSL